MLHEAEEVVHDPLLRIGLFWRVAKNEELGVLFRQAELFLGNTCEIGGFRYDLAESTNPLFVGFVAGDRAACDAQ